MQTVEQFDAEIYKIAAKAIRAGETHPPMIILLMGNPAAKWNIIDVSGKMNDEADKDMVASLIDMLSLHPSVAIVAFVSEAWMVTDPKAMAEGVRPSQHPQRIECVVVSFSVGNSQRAINTHRIVREVGKRPRLERGTLKIEQGEEVLEGRFFSERRQAH